MPEVASPEMPSLENEPLGDEEEKVVEQSPESQEYSEEDWEKMKEDYGIEKDGIVVGLATDGHVVKPRVLKIDEENGRVVFDTEKGQVLETTIAKLMQEQEAGRLVKPVREQEVLGMFEEGDKSLDEIIVEVDKTNPRLANEISEAVAYYNEGNVAGQTSPDAFVMDQLKEAMAVEEGESSEVEKGTETAGTAEQNKEAVREALELKQVEEEQGQAAEPSDAVRRAAQRAKRSAEQEQALQQEADKRRQAAIQAGQQQFKGQGPRFQQRMAAEKQQEQAKKADLAAARQQAGQGLGSDAERRARRAQQAQEQLRQRSRSEKPGKEEKSEEAVNDEAVVEEAPVEPSVVEATKEEAAANEEIEKLIRVAERAEEIKASLEEPGKKSEDVDALMKILSEDDPVYEAISKGLTGSRAEAGQLNKRQAAIASLDRLATDQRRRAEKRRGASGSE